MNEPFEETMLSFSPSSGFANAENYSEHRDWYAEHRETVSEVGETMIQRYRSLYAPTIVNGIAHQRKCEPGHFWKHVPTEGGEYADMDVTMFPRWNGVLHAICYEGDGSREVL
jgi:hypothetical protein